MTVNRFQGLELWLGSVGFFADAPNGAQLRKASLVTWVPRWARASLIPWEIGAQAWPQQAVRADRHVMSAGWP